MVGVIHLTLHADSQIKREFQSDTTHLVPLWKNLKPLAAELRSKQPLALTKTDTVFVQPGHQLHVLVRLHIISCVATRNRLKSDKLLDWQTFWLRMHRNRGVRPPWKRIYVREAAECMQRPLFQRYNLEGDELSHSLRQLRR